MHLAEEVVCQASVIVESAQISAANVANLKFLVARRTRSIRQGLKLAFLLVLPLFKLSYFPKLGDGLIDGAIFGENPDFLQTNVDVLVELIDCFILLAVSPQSNNSESSIQSSAVETHQLVGLTYLLRRLLQSPLRSVYPPVTVVDVFLHVA
jgi:hypothetical protein